MQGDFLTYALAFIAVLSILVTIHEFGHYIIARWSGVQVVKFSVGFGRPLWSWTDRHGTEFGVAYIPLGGYVRMLDDRDPDQAAELKPGRVAYMDLHPAWRIAIALGGPGANILLAVFVFWLLSVAGMLSVAPAIAGAAEDSAVGRAGLTGPARIMEVDGIAVNNWQDVGLALTDRLGETGNLQLSVRAPGTTDPQRIQIPIERWHEGDANPDLLGSLGLKPAQLSVVGGVAPDTPAEAAGLMEDDWIRTADGDPVGEWGDLVAVIEKSAGMPVVFEFVRDGQTRTISVVPASTPMEDGSVKGTLGIYPSYVEVSRGVFEAIPYALDETWDKTLMTLGIIKKMFTGQVSVKNLSGPISIAQIAGDSASYSWRSFVTILGFLSISLAVLNMLPVPILDGGQVVFSAVEWAMGRPVPERVQILGVQIGLFLVGTMLIFVTYNDLLRLFE